MHKSNMTSMASQIIPGEWPVEVAERYEAVKELGHGSFASVILAKTKTAPPSYHAIKVVGNADATRRELAYALREIGILAELDHPNIMRLIDHWEPSQDSHTCAAVMALSYSEGPTLAQLLEKRGCLSIKCARVISAQLVSAVAYLHGKAVIHRDISPANIVVSVASIEDDAIWKDSNLVASTNDWNTLMMKWHITLVDFGFARALTPDDKKEGSPKPGGECLNLCVSKLLTRTMSSLGTREYAAPEILEGLYNKAHTNDLSDSPLQPIDITRTLSEHVSYYGLIVDAFSVGNTIKHMLTGVAPYDDVDEMIARQRKSKTFLRKLLCNFLAKKSQTWRHVEYRAVCDIPPEASRLINAMTQSDPRQRASVRMARLYPWIDQIFVDHLSCSSQSIEFLSFTLRPHTPEAGEEKVDTAT